MTKSKSWARHEYKMAYGLMRRGWEFETIARETGIHVTFLKAADYSYQAYGCEPNGWSGHRRYRAFLHIKWRILSRREELPF